MIPILSFAILQAAFTDSDYIDPIVVFVRPHCAFVMCYVITSCNKDVT